ncbi:MAG: hypothetical protein KJ645_11350 [Planctomycetes bacterium]|nr:hypothetical protein [Planctomycetota bacterium]
MKIERCAFGRVIINGREYVKDVVVYPDRIQENWWRRNGHSLVEDDLPQVFARPPAVFVIGCGQQRALKVPEKTRQAFQGAGIELLEQDTPTACETLNRLFAEGADAAGGLHLTC